MSELPPPSRWNEHGHEIKTADDAAYIAARDAHRKEWAHLTGWRPHPSNRRKRDA